MSNILLWYSACMKLEDMTKCSFWIFSARQSTQTFKFKMQQIVILSREWVRYMLISASFCSKKQFSMHTKPSYQLIELLVFLLMFIHITYCLWENAYAIQCLNVPKTFKSFCFSQVNHKNLFLSFLCIAR